MMVFWAMLGALAVPAIAYASTGGDTSATSVALAAVSLAVQTYVATRIGPLEREVRTLKSEVATLKAAHGGMVE